jgi:hypothetical protein
MREINEVKILDTIPLDYFLHVVFGQAIYLICRLFKISALKSFLVVLVIELCKEITDSFAMTNTIEENLADFALTISLPLLSFLIERKTTKAKLN